HSASPTWCSGRSTPSARCASARRSSSKVWTFLSSACWRTRMTRGCRPSVGARRSRGPQALTQAGDGPVAPGSGGFVLEAGGGGRHDIAVVDIRSHLVYGVDPQTMDLLDVAGSERRRVRSK